MKKALFSTLVVLFLLSAIAYAARKNAVKIAVASNSKDPKSSISSRAGHCPYYLIFNGAGELIEVLANPYKDAQRRAGQQTANLLADKGVTIVIAENYGEKMIWVMRNNGTTYFKHHGAILDAVKKVLGPGNGILIKLDRNLGPVSCESYRKLINIEPNGRKKEYVLFTVRKGQDKVAALFLSPESKKGRSTLRLADNMWLYIPDAGKPLRIKKLQSVAGGVFNNSDILRLDYAAEYFVKNMEELSDRYILNLKAKTKTAAYDKLKMWVDKDKILPIKVQCLTEASRLIKTIYFKQPRDFGDKILRPSVIEADSPLHKGHKSVMQLSSIKKRTFKDEVFTLTVMPNLESLRQ